MLVRRLAKRCVQRSAARLSDRVFVRLCALVLSCLLGTAVQASVDGGIVIDALSTAPLATGEETSQAQIDAVIAPLLGDSTQLYKSNVGGGDEGPFADHYATTFTGDDPNGAVIKWLGAGFIAEPTHLLVKDGNADPAWYLFDFSGWDGKSTVKLVNFWTGVRGAISHVTLYGIKRPPQPAIDVKKSAGEVVNNGDDTFSVPITITVTNTGNEALSSLQLEDDLDIFGAGRLIAVDDLTSATLTVNPNYDGLTDLNLLTGTDNLPVAASATVTFTVRFDPGDETGPFVNTVMARATGQTSGEVVSGSNDASFPARPPAPPEPAIAVQKSAGEVVDNGNDTFSVPITITVTNTGDDVLTALQLQDSLDIFGAGQLIAVEDLTSTTLSINPNYDGLIDNALLAGTDNLPVAASATVTFTVRFDPADEPGPFVNAAVARATGQTSGEVVSDSNDASFPARPPAPPEPAIAVQKSAGAVVDNGNDTFSVPITITVTNTGNDVLTALQLQDSLDIFGAGQLIAVEDLTSTTLSINPNYDGLTDIDVLTGSDNLPVAASATVTFTVRFDPADEPGPFVNAVVARATGQTSGEVVSGSNDASFPARPPAPPEPAIAVQKSAGEVVDNGDDTFSVPITITVTNTGDDVLTALQLQDSLDIFGTGQLIAVDDLTSATLTVNPNYDGLTDIDLLTGTDNLPVATSATVSFTVRFDPADESGPFVNAVVARATGQESGEVVSDSNDASFPARPPAPREPAIAVQKSAGEVLDNGDDTFSVPITITVTNTGDDVLTALQLQDSLDIFGTGQLIAVEDLTSTTLSINPNYDGLTDIDLLAGADNLPVAASATVTFTVRFDPADESGPFVNAVVARATGQASGEVVSGSNDASFPARPPAPPEPAIAVQKSAGELVDNGDDTFSVPITITVTNTGNEVLTSLQIEDDLDIFGAGQLIAVEDLTSTTLSINPNYDGLTDLNLLTGTDNLPVATSATVTFTVRFDPGDETGPFVNAVVARATGQTSREVVSGSNDASFPARPPAPPEPAVEVQKSAGEVSDNGNDTFSVPITITVTNTGNDVLTALQLQDSLDIFGTGQLISVESLTSPDLSINASYDGLTVINLLTGTDNLPVAASATVTFTVRFDPADEPGPFVNAVVARATGQTSGEVVSDSNDASFPARPPAPPEPAIAVQKSAGAVSDNGDDTFSVPITITVANTGNEALSSLQLEDDLDIFGSGQLIAVESLTSPDLSINASYDGLTDINLLTGTDNLPVAISATVTFTVRFDPANEPGPFVNTVIANATGETSGDPVSDSQDASFDRPQPPPSGTADIFVTKTADRNQVVRGDTIGYEVSVDNLTANPVIGVEIADIPPAGFRFIDDSALLIRAGADRTLNTADDVASAIGTSGTNLIMFAAFDLGPNERILVRYLMRVSVGVVDGEYINNVIVTPTDRDPVRASVPVIVAGDPIFEKTTLIGKVFDDRNENGLQDKDEHGIRGARLATVGGLIIETDANGRYHLPDVDVKRFVRGANFIIKLDMASLPERTTMLSENPRVMRLTQATMSKINFAVKLPTGKLGACFESCLIEEDRIKHERLLNLEMCVGAPPYDPAWPEGPRSPSVVDSSKTECTLHTGPLPTDSAVAREITVSGGLFGCGTLVADTLPGRDARPRSEVTVFAREDNILDRDRRSCYVSKIDRLTIRAGDYPIELQTKQGTTLRITNSGDVIRIGYPKNDEHIFVTPFRDDTDNTVISALRIVNDGIEPFSEEVSPTRSADTPQQITSGTVDNLFVDPRLDVLALNRAVVDSNGDLIEPIQFGVYTNYAAFIKGYKLEIYGRYKDGFDKILLHKDEFSDYRFDQQREFEGKNLELSQYAELEYLLKASDCPPPLDEGQCIVDVTSARILNLHDAGRDSEIHRKSELWGQSSLTIQRIPIRGGRVRITGKADPDPDQAYVQVNGSYVPIAKDGSYVLEEHLPLSAPRFNALQGDADVGQPGDTISADATKITVSGGLFGCGTVEIDSLPGRQKDNRDRINAATVVADPDGQWMTAGVCPEARLSGLYPIEIKSAEGSILAITTAGDVVSVEHPEPDKNRQQLVVTPFRDYTDSTKVSALRISNEGIARELARDPPPAEPPMRPEENDWFTVALANLTIGKNNVSGNALPLSADNHYDGSVYTDGRVAFYAKGKIDDKYLITAQLDSTEDELRNLNDNLKRKDPRRIFRQLDPNRYYPIYGDDSTTTTDVDTQGAFYARIDWDQNTALWGNYNTGLTDTEFMQYNRSLYGAKFEHKNLETTGFGNTKTKVSVFGSEAQSVAAHVTFRATGGSLYYLRDTDIVQGSEKVWIEVRRRDTEQVVERAVLIEGRDYEIDAIQGRIILRRPLSQVVADRQRSIIRSTPLEGDEVFLLADYEYVPTAFVGDDLTFGGRGQAWLGDHVAIGATSVTDERNGTDYSLQGADLTLQRSKNTYLRAEFAQSRARQNNTNFISSDGGLTFQSQTAGGSGDSLNGDATAIEVHADLAEFSDALQGDLHAWWKTREAEFSTGRLGQGVGVNDSGVEMRAKMGNDVEITATHTDLEREQLARERVTRVQVEGHLGDLDAGMEVRHEDIDVHASALAALISGLNGASSDGEALLIGARLGYDISDDTSIYAAGQTVADDKGIYAENDLITVGVNTKLDEELAISFEVSDGDRGSALTAGVDYAIEDGLNFNVSGGVGSGAISQFATRYAIGEGHELYGSYAVDPDRTDGARNLLTLGQRRAFGSTIDLFAESQFGKNDRYASVGHVFGLEFEGDDDWRFSASMQFSENEGQGIAFDRRALSFGAYRNQGDLKLSSRIEYREDDGAGVHNRQYVSSSSFTRVLDEDRRWLGQLNISWTDDELNGGHDARFVELDVGYAHRPAANDKLNLIGRYSFLYDLPTEGQATMRPDERSHVVSIEGIYDPANRWEFAAKAAIRKGEQRSLRDTGPWQEFGLRLASIRARYQVTRKWDGLAEYRLLSDFDGNNERHGALLGLYRQVGGHFKVGIGFNFTDFNDELRVESYDNRGWFVDLIGKY